MKLKDKNLYYVGGVVRDEIIKKKSLDIDYCYEGNAIEFAKKKGLNIIRENENFGTVRINMNGQLIDIASTRKEEYPKKGHLPVVTEIGCSLEEDLLRRDFTINAMAKRTTDDKIFDPQNGMKDLRNGKLQVLTVHSFEDDPTRIIRGLKFFARFGFVLSSSTKELQKEYLNNINYDMSYHRLKKELIETFNLNKQLAYSRFVHRGIYKLLAPNQVKPKVVYPIEKVLRQYPCNDAWLVYMGFFDISNLSLTRREKNIIHWFEKLKTEKPVNNTPFESIIMHKIWKKNL